MRRHPPVSDSNLPVSTSPSASSGASDRELPPSLLKESGQGETSEPLRQQATELLTEAHRLLAQEAVRQHALEQCLETLQAASLEAYFFFTLDPPSLTPAPYKRPGSAKARRLQPRFAAALLQSHERQATRRLTTLHGLVRRGVPVAVWHFLALTPLPATLAALAPQSSPTTT